MTFGEEAVELGKDVLEKIALEITPDATLVVIDELVHTAVDLELSGKEKFDWVVAKAVEMALSVWELILPLVVQALYDMMMGRLGVSNGTEVRN